eukprot:2928338-Rhodomonas_salina.2
MTWTCAINAVDPLLEPPPWQTLDAQISVQAPPAPAPAAAPEAAKLAATEAATDAPTAAPTTAVTAAAAAFPSSAVSGLGHCRPSPSPRQLAVPGKSSSGREIRQQEARGLRQTRCQLRIRPPRSSQSPLRLPHPPEFQETSRGAPVVNLASGDNTPSFHGAIPAPKRRLTRLMWYVRYSAWRSARAKCKGNAQKTHSKVPFANCRRRHNVGIFQPVVLLVGKNRPTLHPRRPYDPEVIGHLQQPYRNVVGLSCTFWNWTA